MEELKEMKELRFKPDGCKGSYMIITEEDFLKLPLRGSASYKIGEVYRVHEEITLESLNPVLEVTESKDSPFDSMDNVDNIDLKYKSYWVTK